jgi:hypothetical protein
VQLEQEWDEQEPQLQLDPPPGAEELLPLLVVPKRENFFVTFLLPQAKQVTRCPGARTSFSNS